MWVARGLNDVITEIEPDLLKAVTGLTVEEFQLLVSLSAFDSTHLNQAVFVFRGYEDSSLSNSDSECDEGLRHFGLYDSVVASDPLRQARKPLAEAPTNPLQRNVAVGASDTRSVEQDRRDDGSRAGRLDDLVHHTDLHRPGHTA